jgi:predicted transcriptional regulator
MPRAQPSIPISDAESEVMEVLWTRSPQDADEIHRLLADRRDWQLATVKTLVNRLLHKGAIEAERDGRRYLYRPVLQREAWLREQSMGLLDRLFDGRLSPLVSHFAKHRKLSAADIAALKALLKEQEK